MRRLAAAALLALAAPVSAEVPVVPSAALPTASPVAKDLASRLFPDGTYRKLLGPAMGQMMSGVTDGIGAMPMGPLLKAAGLPEADAARLDKARLGEIMAIMDPAYKERMRRLMDGMFAAMIPLFEQLEPDLRAGLAVALDHRFSPAQLAELRTFFATPTGSAYAAQQMLLFMDPAVMGRMQAAMPRIMAAMPGFIGQAAKATADLPKPRTYQDLTPAERSRLAQLLGVDAKKLH